MAIPHSPHVPHDRQVPFLLDFGKEALYGGAAGGGKSDALLMGALMFVDVPRYTAILFRRTYKDLVRPGALMDRAVEWLAGRPGVRWREKDYTFTFVRSGARLTFGHLELEKDKLDYQGGEYQFVGFDELTQFGESQYRYLFSRLRRPADLGAGHALARVPLRMRAGTNPGGPGHEWVHRRFIVERGRRFYPARLEDNPFLDRDTYEEQLRELDPIEYQQLRHGDWLRPQGGMFKRASFEIVDAAPAGSRARYWDMASTDPKKTKNKDPDYTAGALLSIAPDGTIYVEHVARFRKDPAESEMIQRRIAEADGPNVPVRFEEEPGSSGKRYADYLIRQVFRGFIATADRVTGPKIERAKPLASRAARGHVKLVRGEWNTAFLDEAEAFPLGGHDDMIDACGGAYAMLSGGSAGLFLQALAPACRECGQPNRQGESKCSRCGAELLA